MEREQDQASILYNLMCGGSEISQDVLFGLNPNYKETIKREIGEGVVTRRTIMEEGVEVTLIKLAEEPRYDPWDRREYRENDL